MVPGMADVEHQGEFCGESFMRLCLVHRFAGSENPLFDWLGKGGPGSAERVAILPGPQDLAQYQSHMLNLPITRVHVAFYWPARKLCTLIGQLPLVA